MTQLSHNSPLALGAPAARSTGLARLGDYAQLAKLRITVMVALTTWLGFAMGVSAMGGEFASATAPWWLLPATLAGVALSCMGASALNQVRERDVDGLMRRTRNRPLPAERIAPSEATAFGVACAAAGVVILAALANLPAAAVALFTILSYVFIYTPMKRRSSTSVIVGAVPGALPPVIGYVAATGHVGPAAVAMFAIMFLWQLPHFLAIAWLYRDDYAAAGMPMLPVLDPTGETTFRHMLLGCLALLPLGLLPTVMGLCGPVYFSGALLAGVMFLACGVLLTLKRTRRHARLMFFASLVYLPLVLGLMAVDQA